jgi:hypothetical protein
MTVRMTKAQLLTLHSYLLDIWTKAAAYSTRLCTLEDLTNDERLTLRDHACSTAVRETLGVPDRILAPRDRGKHRHAPR